MTKTAKVELERGRVEASTSSCTAYQLSVLPVLGGSETSVQSFPDADIQQEREPATAISPLKPASP